MHMGRYPFGDETLIDPVVRLLAAALKQECTSNSHYGVPFCRALDWALVHLENGIAYEPYTATHYRVQSGSRAWCWHHVTLTRCSCEDTTTETDSPPWCWHRALLHLLTAQTALTMLDRCPRPTLARVSPRRGWDIAAILRECDE